MHPDLTSQSFHACRSSLTTSHSKKEENKSIFYCSYTHWSMAKFLVDSLPREEEFFSAWIYARSHQLRKSCGVAREKWSHLSLAYSTACVMGLSFPHSYHGWDCCIAVSEGCSSSKPMTQLVSPCFDWRKIVWLFHKGWGLLSQEGQDQFFGILSFKQQPRTQKAICA